ncbi:MAG TPA: hypothetical protein VIS76_16325 [Pseudomonadales bacterium]
MNQWRLAVQATFWTSLTLLLGGCMPDLRSEHPAPRVYWLDAVALADPPAVNPTVELVPGLDTDRIWLLEPDQRLNYYAGAFWPDRLQAVLQSLLERSVGEGGGGADVHVLVERYFAVGDPNAGPPDLEIAARIETQGLHCRFESRRRSESERLRDIVAGHQQLFDELVEAIVSTVRSGACP